MQINNTKSVTKTLSFFIAFYDYLLVKLKNSLLVFKQWHENKRSRDYLSDMSPHLLKDIGITESERQEELRKKFWQ